jgi:hypothetical protein
VIRRLRRSGRATRSWRRLSAESGWGSSGPWCTVVGATLSARLYSLLLVATSSLLSQTCGCELQTLHADAAMRGDHSLNLRKRVR